MTIKEVLTLPIEPWMQQETKKLRQNTPRLLKTIIEQTFEFSGIASLAELTRQSLISLEGGVSSAVYLIKKTEDSIVIKLRHQGVSAEAEAMNAWQQKGANVIAIKTTGLLKSPNMTVKYLIQEGILRPGGAPAETVHQFVLKNPKKAYELGYLRGAELSKMHKAKSARKTFGQFADMSGKKAPFRSWNSYLLSQIDSQVDLLLKIGLEQKDLQKIRNYIKEIAFPKSGIYLHGDFTTRNNLVETKAPLKIRVFDPNPLIGHQSWDIALVFNHYEIAKKRFHNSDSKELKLRYKIEHDLLKGFIEGYEYFTNQKIDRRRIYPSQLILATFHLDAIYKQAKKRTRNPWQDREVIDSKNTVLDNASMILLYS